MKTITTLFALTLSASINTAAIAQETGVHGTVVVGAATAPEYEGSDKQRIVPLVVGRINDGNRYVAFEGPTLRANVLDSRWLELGLVMNVTAKRGRNIKSLAVSRLGAIKDAVEAGAFVAVSHGVSGNDRIRFAIQGVQDISGVHKGWLGSATASYAVPINPKLTLAADVAATYASADYARTYFTISAAGSVSSGLAAFNAKSGIKDVGGSMTVRYALSKRSSLLGLGAYKRLLGSVADSPIVRGAGSPDQFVGAIGVGFSF